MTAYHYVFAPSAVTALAETIRALPPDTRIALDTEFHRETEYFPRFALLQLCFKGEVYIVDPLSCDISAVMAALVETPCQVLFFAGEEDLQIVVCYAREHNLSRLYPEHCADVQLLGAFVQHSYKCGLDTMVKDLLGLTLPKEETRSDWLLRPLRDEQLTYAADDVYYLEKLYDCLYERADAEHRAWFAAEMQLFVQEQSKLPDPALAYRSAGGAGLLKPADMTVLQYLCEQRMLYALAHDEALNRIITSNALCEIARKRPRTEAGLSACGMRWGAIRDHGTLVLQWLAEAQKLPVRTDLPLPFDYFAHKRDLHPNFKALRDYMASCAHAHNLPSPVIGNKKSVYGLFLARAEGRKGKLETGWRGEILGNLDRFFLPMEGKSGGRDKAQPAEKSGTEPSDKAASAATASASASDVQS